MNLHKLLYFLSKYLWIVPVVCLVFAIIFKIKQNLYGEINNKNFIEKIKITPKKSIVPTPNTTKKENLVKSCSFSSQDNFINANISTNEASFKMKSNGKETLVIIKNNCIYQWEKYNAEGSVFCKEELVSSSSEGSKDFLSLLEKSSISPEILKLIMTVFNCEDKLNDENIFAIPQDVNFLKNNLKK